jgi:ubiquinone/menaquinone biosynthesis C-methylase UbiE
MLKKIQPLLKCPQTNKSLSYNEQQNRYEVKKDNIVYPVNDGIIDFLYPISEKYESDAVIKAYNKISNRYDSLITSSTFVTKLIIYISWGGIHEDYTELVVNSIPDDFQGVILDVPVGTGIYMAEKYAVLKTATIIVVDFSLGMLKEAQKKYKERHIDNVIYIHGDVGHLPFENDSVDFVLSMNGFHSFSEKEKAVFELHRILKGKGKFAGCFYVRGKRKLSDFIVNVSLKNSNLFAEPFYTENEYIEIFSKYFDFIKTDFCRSFFLYEAQKKG